MSSSMSSVYLPLFNGFDCFAVWPSPILVWNIEFILISINLTFILIDNRFLQPSLQISNEWSSFNMQRGCPSLLPWMCLCCLWSHGWLPSKIMNTRNEKVIIYLCKGATATVFESRPSFLSNHIHGIDMSRRKVIHDSYINKSYMKSFFF